jgi:hypothetical protein
VLSGWIIIATVATTRMEMTAHQLRFGVDDEDEPFTFLWTHDDELDFVFSLSRPIDGNNETPIEYMVLDQLWEPVGDFPCRVDNDCIRAYVPAGLRRYTSNSDEIVVHHGCIGDKLSDLIHVLRALFIGKTGLEVRVT